MTRRPTDVRVAVRALALSVCCGVAALTAGCNATETGNPVAQQTLALTSRSSSDAVSIGDSGAAIRVTDAWIVLGDLRFIKSEDCDRGASSRVDVEGPIAVDLVSAPDELELRLDAARYCRVRVRIEKAKDLAGAPAELEDESIALEGQRADGTSFRLRSRANFDLDLRARGDGFDLSSGRGAMILAFDLATWLEGLDLDVAEAGSTGAIEIDDGHEKARLAVFEANVKQALELFKDANRDSRLDDSELTEPLAGFVER